ncbi:MAG: DUF3857 domain-containing protein [Bacteroidota bacterium]
MNKPLMTIIILMISISPVLSQDFTPVFNAISEEEWETGTYDKFPDSEAVVLFDIGKTRFVKSGLGYDIRFTRHKRIKILKSSGVDHAEVSIPFYFQDINKTEYIENLKAYTYNLIDGNVRGNRVSITAVFEEQINKNWKVKKFAFPDVQEGSIVEFKYDLVSPFKFNLPDWDFQSDIPTLYSEYEVRTIPFYEYVYITSGIQEFDSVSNVKSDKSYYYPGASATNSFGKSPRYNEIINRFIMKDIPAFEDVSFITSRNDYLKRMDFQLSKVHSSYSGTREIMTTWPKMTKSFLEIDEFGKYLKSSESQAKKILKSELLLNENNQLQNVKVITGYVKSNFNWNYKTSKYATKTAKKFTEQKTGNMAEINLFLCGMLNAAGISATPVLLSTRKHGKVHRKYPFTQFFNAVVVLVKIDGKSFLTDATDPLIAFDRIPPHCINDYGLTVEKDNPGWVKLVNSNHSESGTTFMVSIDTASMTANATISNASTEMEAYVLKQRIGDDTENFNEFLESKGFSVVEGVRLRNFQKPEKPFLIIAKATTDLETVGDRMLITPFFNFNMSQNLLKQDSRDYPIDLIYDKTEKFTSRITIPQGYQVAKLPDEFAINDELMTSKLTYSLNGNALTVAGHYTFKKAIYEKEDYLQLKKHFADIVNNFGKHVMLVKNSE